MIKTILPLLALLLLSTPSYGFFWEDPCECTEEAPCLFEDIGEGQPASFTMGGCTAVRTRSSKWNTKAFKGPTNKGARTVVMNFFSDSCHKKVVYAEYLPQTKQAVWTEDNINFALSMTTLGGYLYTGEGHTRKFTYGVLSDGTASIVEYSCSPRELH